MPTNPTTSKQSTAKVASIKKKPLHAAQLDQALHAALIPGALIKLKTAGAIADLSDATLYRKAKTDPTFPKLIRLGNRCTRINADSFLAWLAAQGTGPVEVS